MADIWGVGYEISGMTVFFIESERLEGEKEIENTIFNNYLKWGYNNGLVRYTGFDEGPLEEMKSKYTRLVPGYKM